MALFKKKTKETSLVNERESSNKEKEATVVYQNSGFENVLMRPRITEKASDQSSKNVYVFDVSKEATKHEITKAVRSIYKVSPVKIGIVKIPAKKIIVRGKRGVRAGGKKAYVYLKEGDKIEFV